VLKTAFDLPSPLLVQMYNKRAWPEFLMARGQYADALAGADVLIAHPVSLVRAIGHIEAGRAQVAAGRFQNAADDSNRALAELRSAADGQALVAPALSELQGEFFLRTGQRGKGEQALRDLVGAMRALPGPDNWVQALFTLEAVARSARDADDWTFARWAATQMLAHDARYAGSHYALALVAQHDRDTATASREFRAAVDGWNQGDRSLPELAQASAAVSAGAKP
jgi:Tfp pilus assembly protein PilF